MRSPPPRPRVSIGIPVYDGEAFIEETLDCVLAQTYEDFEVVISDNASTDRTSLICQAYAARDARIRYTRNEVNRGAAYNYNRVLSLARGEFHKWLAADDLLAPEWLERCLDTFAASPGAVLAYPRVSFIDESGGPIETPGSVLIPGPWPTHPVERARRLIDLLSHDGLAAMALIFGLARTEPLRQLRPLGNYYGADWTVVLELALAGEFCEVPETLASFRRHQSSSSLVEAHDPERQQRFYDPRVRGALRVRLQFRRRYWEIFRSITHARLHAWGRLSLAGWAAYAIARRASRRWRPA